MKTPTDARRGSGWVYFVQSGPSIKIGCTKNPGKRMDSLRIASAHPMRLLAVIHAPDDRYGLEREIRRRWEHLQTTGEWFRATPELLLYIAIHATAYCSTANRCDWSVDARRLTDLVVAQSV